MVRSHGALIGWALAALVLSQTGAQARPDPAADVATFEAGFSAALARNDVGALKRYLSEDWTIVSGDGGTITRARFLAVIASGDLKHDQMSSQDQVIRLHGDTALVTARARSDGSYKGTAFHTDEIGTDVIMRRHGRWVCVFTQLTSVAPAH